MIFDWILFGLSLDWVLDQKFRKFRFRCGCVFQQIVLVSLDILLNEHYLVGMLENILLFQMFDDQIKALLFFREDEIGTSRILIWQLLISVLAPNYNFGFI